MEPKERESRWTKGLKKQEAYPQIQFSTKPKVKERIMKKIEKLRKLANKNNDGPILFTKGDIGIEALELGLEQLEKKLKK